MSDDAPLTESERQMMAYVDDELAPEERADFERAMEQDPGLAMEAVKFQNLLDMSRSLTLSEPSDHEMRRFWGRFYNRTEWQLGWVLLLAGVAVLLAEILYLVFSTDALTWLAKAAFVSVVIGGGLLIWNTVRLKMRTSHFDRYRGVMR